MYNCFHVLKFQFEKKNSVRYNLEVSVYDTSFSYANFQNHVKCVGQTFFIVYPVILFVSDNNFTNPEPSGINNSTHIANNESESKTSLVSKSPGADMPFNQQIFQNIPFDDDLTHVTLFVIVIEDVTTYYNSKNCQKTDKK